MSMYQLSTEFSKNWWSSLCIILLTNKQKMPMKHNLLGGVKYTLHKYGMLYRAKARSIAPCLHTLSKAADCYQGK